MRALTFAFAAVALLLLAVFALAAEEAEMAVKPAVRYRAPDFSATALLPGGKFGKVSLSDYKGKWVILFFYPLDFTFVCPTEIIEFSRAHETFAANDAQILGVSVDSHFSHLAWSKVPVKEGGIGPISFPLLSDLDKSVSDSYDVLLKSGPDAGVALRGTFIIDPSGIVRHAAVNDLPVGRSVPEVQRLLQAFQFADTNGNVCPSKWKPGGQTIKPNPDDAKEFFASADL
uniref:thioredoxin-dependent peroxiredoxin n=1 Tax=Neobodo designis TaxID=312471 RepID=A0A7S1MRX6_NEODS|mmetsp:Transcript_46079/g.141904  ORF Transcript_46079/g.141904 Transcript_46079/m.141904 type:complete len:230 (+) Transcript_46079:35-724(+)